MVLYENKAPLGVAINLMETGFRSDVEFVMPHDASNEQLSKEFSEVLRASQDAKTQKTIDIKNNN